MAQQELQPERDSLRCSICLDLMREPATIPCGHSYCLHCVGKYWDEEDHKEAHSCPQCRRTFRPRPVLVRNTVLADLVEERRRTGPPDAPDAPDPARPGDVPCDLCSETKLRAVKSCLQCLVSYCQQHLQPHLSVAALRRHRLAEPSQTLKDSVCPLHGEVMKIFCRTDQSCICYLCLMDEHEGHQTLSAAAEASRKERELGASREELLRRIRDEEQEVEELKRAAEDVNRSADEALVEAEKIFEDAAQQIRRRQRSEVDRVRELQEKLEEEIGELRRRSAALEELSRTKDHVRFLQACTAFARLAEAAEPARVSARPSACRREADGPIAGLRERLQDVLTQEWSQVPPTGSEVEVLVPEAEPLTRDDFLKYHQKIYLDPMTSHWFIDVDLVSAKYIHRNVIIPNHPDQFSDWIQVLCREGLTGRCYWEVVWRTESVRGDVFIAASYRDISRKGDESVFGNNRKSWALQCCGQGYEFRHDCIRTAVSGPKSSRIGVYLDHGAGVLSFYSVSEDTMTLLHRVQTTFTQPLCPGFGLYCSAVDIQNDVL